MLLLLKIKFWICFIALAHTYLFYPLLLKLLAYFKKDVDTNNNPSLPSLSILIAAYNEEKVIEQKLKSILNSNYPKDKIEILVGSDASTDKTNEIVRSFSNVKLIEFEKRSGKIKIINQLKNLAAHNLLILTDANVLFDKDTLQQLCKHFNDPEIALVDSNIINTHLQKGNVSKAESTYIRGEAAVKYHEGKLFGLMMGPFGGCFAVRKEHFEPVPENFLVDDFYINMKILQKGKKAISEPHALVYEDVPNDWKIEFKRKIRIAAGSYQNLKEFFPLLFKFNLLAFCFFSHKVLRWLGPFLMIGLYVSNIALLPQELNTYSTYIYLLAFIMQNSLLLLFIGSLIGVKNLITQIAFHFITTNVALLAGFIKFITGIRSSIWKPTARFSKN